MKRVICLSGDAGCGKSTVAKLLQTHLDWTLVSAGEIARSVAQEQNLTPQQISTELGDEFHLALDNRIREILIHQQQIIAESRLVGYLARNLGDSLRVFVHCPLEIRAERIQKRDHWLSVAEAVQKVKDRDEADTANLKKLYQIDYHDPRYYQLIVDSSLLSPEQIMHVVLEESK